MLQYQPLNEYRALTYAQKLRNLFPEHAQLVCREIGEGNLNRVFRITDEQSGKGIVIKQALPYARAAHEAWPLSFDRARIESQALILQNTICPGLVPQVYRHDPVQGITVMEDLPDCLMLREGLAARKRYPLFARHIGAFLARTLFFTSDFALPSQVKKEKAARFTNSEMCKITEERMFTDPYYGSETVRFNPLIAAPVEQIWTNNRLKLEAAKLKEGFLTRSQALVHGDLHSGSILVTDEETKVIDPEFSFYGPVGFDIGVLFGSLLLHFASYEGHAPDTRERMNDQAYLLTLIEQIWSCFEQEFRELWENQSKEPMARIREYVDHYLLQVLADTSGYAGCEMIRGVIGPVQAPELDSIGNPHLRAHGETLALLIGQGLVLERTQVQKIYDMTSLIRDIAL